MPIFNMQRSPAYLLAALGLTVAIWVSLQYSHFTPLGMDTFNRFNRIIQKSMLYSPKKYSDEEERQALLKYGLNVEKTIVDLVAVDKARLRAYWIPHRDNGHPTLLPTVLYLHGNMGKIEWGLSSSRAWQHHMRVNFLVLSYRGFGRSEGEPDKMGVLKDSQAALEYLKHHPEVAPDKIILYGHSLGGAVALHLATALVGHSQIPQKTTESSPIAAVIVENTFLRIARVIFGNSWMANLIEPLIHDNWNNERQLKRLAEYASRGTLIPHVLVLAGENDLRVPAWHSEGLWRQLKEIPGAERSIRALHKFIGGAHTCHNHPDYHHRIKNFLNQVFPNDQI